MFLNQIFEVYLYIMVVFILSFFFFFLNDHNYLIGNT